MIDGDELLLLLAEDDDDLSEQSELEVMPSAWWDVVYQPWHQRYWAWPLYKTPAEILYGGLNVSEVIGSATVTAAAVTYAVGHGLTYSASATVLAERVGVGVNLSGGRRNTRHVLLVTITTSDSQLIVVQCPVQITK